MKIRSESLFKQLKSEKFGKSIYSFEEVGSTNEVAHELAINGAPEGTVVISDSQTRGKGRLERKWISPSGKNIYISIIFRPAIEARDAPFLTLVSSIALAEAIRNEGTDAFIKWPNDVLIDDRKVAGVLTEMTEKGGSVDFVIVGLGVNINMTDQDMDEEMGEVAEIATSLRMATGREINRVNMIVNLIEEIEHWYNKYLEKGKPPIVKEWMGRWGAINRRVLAKFNGEEIVGVAIGINENGYLMIKKDDGNVERIITGDVILV